MKCPKCGYIGFEATDRCRNCGYEFALTPAVTSPAADLPMRSAEDERLTTDLALQDAGTEPRRKSGRALDLDRLIGAPDPGDLPLFEDREPQVEAPVVTPPPVVRRPPPRRDPVEPPRPRRARQEAADGTGTLELPLADTPSVRVARRPQPAAAEAAEPTVRLLAALVDLALLLAIDLVTIHYTLRLCDLSWSEWTLLPIWPLGAFFLLLNGGYLVAFTSAGGQTIGKMAFGLRVVGDGAESVAPLTAVVRAALCLASVLSLGAGFAPVFAGGRAIEDRVAATHVVKLPA